MKNDTFQSMLSHLAQEAADPEAINLWPMVRNQMAAESRFAKAGVLGKQPPRLNLKSLALTGAATLALAMGAVFALPQGRAWAMDVLRFFVPTGDRMALPTAQPSSLVEVTPGEAQPTLAPEPANQPAFVDTCGDWAAPRCSFEQIQAMVDFPVRALSSLPEGMEFTGATGGPDGVSLTYLRAEPYSLLQLAQAPAVAGELLAAPVGSSAGIEEVAVQDVVGEYVQGGYFHFGGDSEAVWDPSAELRSLRWVQSDIFYSITLVGSTDFAPQLLDKTGLANLAAGLTETAAAAVTQPEREQLKSIREVEREAGFSVIAPSWLPEGYQFSHAAYLPETETVCLIYRHPADVPLGGAGNPPAPSLAIAENVVSLPVLEDLIVNWLAPEQVLLEQSEVRVGGAVDEQGLHVYGSLQVGKVCGIESLQNQVLLVRTPGLNVSILALKGGPTGDAGNRLTRQQMVRLAESVTGVRTLAEDQPDFERLTSFDQASQLASFVLKFPTLLPEGMNFAYAEISTDAGYEEVTIHYSDGSQAISVRQVKNSPDTPESIRGASPEAFHEVTIHGQPALLSQGYWTEGAWKDLPNGGDGGASVTWFEGGIRYSVSGFNAYPSDVWIEIAESVK